MKEKMTREIRIKAQESLYNEFRQACEEQRKTVSIVIREMMQAYAENVLRTHANIVPIPRDITNWPLDRPFC